MTDKKQVIQYFLFNKFLLSGGLSGSDKPFTNPSPFVFKGVVTEPLGVTAVLPGSAVVLPGVISVLRGREAAGDDGGLSGLGEVLSRLLGVGMECVESLSPLLLPLTTDSLKIEYNLKVDIQF